MGKRLSANRALRVLALVLTGAVVAWAFRRSWTDHDVSDPGVTL
jgi:hypothetical protein